MSFFFLFFQAYLKQIERTWLSFQPFIPRNGGFPSFLNIRTWINDRRQQTPGSLLSEMSRLNRCLGFFFNYDCTRHDLKVNQFVFIFSFFTRIKGRFAGLREAALFQEYTV